MRIIAPASGAFAVPVVLARWDCGAAPEFQQAGILGSDPEAADHPCTFQREATSWPLTTGAAT